MLRKFKVSVDGKEYEVEMEEVGKSANAPVSTVQAAPVSEIQPQPQAPVQPEAPSTSVVEGEGAITTAPMPGTILKILVKVGDAVRENQPLMILEAMKMENEVVAESAGTITAVHVDQGDMVNPGEPLITLV